MSETCSKNTARPRLATCPRTFSPEAIAPERFHNPHRIDPHRTTPDITALHQTAHVSTTAD
ncbi:MAG: hypothetical protein F6J93_06100 [Oscillatoria sp. SIO1A7]|nr:hypothetical protein [Oscillatoria sp. SIO1A7]